MTNLVTYLFCLLLLAGDQRVPGVDYAYTLQGWLKAVNSDTLNVALDMGLDGFGTSVTAKDAVAQSIDYFRDDYSPIARNASLQHTDAITLSLYNGNIARQTQAIGDFQRLSKHYIYDQLNRIRTADYGTINAVTGTITGLTDFHSRYDYDGDGNIKSLVRYGNNMGSGAALMDSLKYVYAAGNTDNKLRELYDNAPGVGYTNDIANFTGSGITRYNYDAIGNTTKDLVSAQDTLKWNLYNKVTATRNQAGNNSMQFRYDGGGNRVAKYYSQGTGTGSTQDNDYYVRDAQGNILAIYHHKEVYALADLTTTWVHDANPRIRDLIAGGGTTFTHDFIAPTFGGDAAMRTHVLTAGLADASFTGGRLGSVPASFFLGRDNNMYYNVLQDGSFMCALGRSDSTTGDSVLIHAFSLQDDAASTGALASVFAADTSANLHSLSLLDTTLLRSAYIEFTNDSVSHDAPYMISTLAATTNPSGLAQSVVSACQNTPGSLPVYMASLAADTASVLGTYGFDFTLHTLLSLTNYGNKDQLLSFFDGYDRTGVLLDRVSTVAQRMGMVYDGDPAAYLTAYATTFGDTAIDDAVSAIPSLSVYSYLSGASVALSVGMPTLLATVSVLQSKQLSLAEHDIYGSSRLGVKNYFPSQVGIRYAPALGYLDTARLWHSAPWYSLEYNEVIKADSVNIYSNGDKSALYAQHITGQKQYELTDHLGDVLVTVSDKRANDSLYNDTIRSYKPIVASAYDYYPFGSYMPGRHTEDTNTYCFTSTITEHVTEVTYVPIEFTTGAVSAVGGGVVTVLPGGVVSAHAFGAGDGLAMIVSDLAPGVWSTLQLTVPTLIGTFRAVIADTITGEEWGSLVLDAGQAMQTEFGVPFRAKGTIGRLSVTSLGAFPGDITIAPIRLPVYTNTTRSVLANVCSGDDYRYGFNGQMKVNEMAGKGNHLNFGARPYDTRIGRPPTIDPLFKQFPWLSPYQFFSNNPIQNIDLDGMEGVDANTARAATNATTKVVTQGSQELSKRAAVNGAGQLVGHSSFWAKAIPWAGRALGTITLVFTPSTMGTGDIPKNQKFPVPETSTAPENTPSPVQEPGERGGYFYVTYTKSRINEDGSVSTYSGRTSGRYNGNAPTEAEADALVLGRDRGHAVLKSEGYSPARRDKFSTIKSAIYGREQHLVDYNGGARSEGCTSRNKIRAVSRSNRDAPVYDAASKAEFGPLPNNNPADNR